jgi:histidyl-tRNA synthetase
VLGLKGIGAAMEYGDKSLKAQMKQANRLGAERVLIVGQSELEAGTVVLRDMTAQTQRDIAVGAIVDTLNEIFSRPGVR